MHKQTNSIRSRKETKPNLRLIIFWTIVFPIFGIALITRSSKKAWSNTKLVSVMTIWLTVWFLGFSYLVLSSATFEAPRYISSIESSKASSDEKYSDSFTIPETKLDDNNTPDNKDGGRNSETNSNGSADGSANGSANRSANRAGSNTEEDDGSSSAQPGDVMSGIRMAEPESVTYDRAAYHQDWSIGSGCNIRSRLLVASSIVAVSFAANGCTVTHGSWIDPYTGGTLTGNPAQGDGTTNDVDIDHIIPLSYVNSHGGYHWSSAKKQAFGSSLSGMQNEAYLPVSAKENNRKSDKGPSRYYPPNPEFRCEYSRKWRDIARSYDIALSKADYELVASVLVSCGIN